MLKLANLPTEAEDCATHEISNNRLLITNIDIVTPIHDDPFIMGQIATTNVINDLYAMNAVDIVNFQAFLGIPFDAPEYVGVEMINGMRDILKRVNFDVSGGHTIQSPWPLLGGSASGIMEKKDLISKRGVKVGDKLLITKPMGIQAIMAAFRLLRHSPEFFEEDEFSKEDIRKIEQGIKIAEKSMTTPNVDIPRIIREYNIQPSIHAMTDVTGFGFKSHLTEMVIPEARQATDEFQFTAKIDKLPVIIMSPKLDEDYGYGILEGCGAEIAGAMLVSIDRDAWDDITRILTAEKVWWFEVGEIHPPSTAPVVFTEDFTYHEIDKY